MLNFQLFLIFSWKVIFLLFFCTRFFRITIMYKAIKTLEEMPGALSYLIEKVEGLERTAKSLPNRQEDCCSPHWMDVDELCDYIPSHPVKQTVYGWVSDRQIPHHKINKALIFLQSEIDDWMKHCGNKSIEKQREYSQKSRTIWKRKQYQLSSSTWIG